MASLDIPGDSDGGTSTNKLTAALSSVDANAMILRFAGKPAKHTGEEKKKNQTPKISKVKESKVKESKTREQRKKSVASVGAKPNIVKTKADEPERPGMLNEMDYNSLDMELDESTIATFRDLFNMLDQWNQGIITADNLYEELRHVDSEVTINEVEDILKKADKNMDGTIDFDEFCLHMAHTGGSPPSNGHDDEETKKKYIKRKKLFYLAITRFSKLTLADIENLFRKHAPHVISHYTAGVRLIGLTTRQMEREMAKMQKSAAKNDSPYAKPLQFVHMGAKKIVRREKKKSYKPSQESTSSRDLAQTNDKPESTVVADLSKEINETMRLFTDGEDGLEPKQRNANLIIQLREKIHTAKQQMMETKEADTLGVNSLSPERAKSSTEGSVGRLLNQADDSKKMRKKKSKSAHGCGMSMRRKLAVGLGWTTPRIQYIDVSLPSLKVKLKSEKPTFNNLHRIRAKVEEAIDVYYHNMRQAAIRNAWDHWDRLYADSTLRKKLQKNFRVVYSAYSPHREEEAFVLAPWKPGPFRFIRHMTKTPMHGLPNNKELSAGISHCPSHIKRGPNLMVQSAKSHTSRLGLERISPLLRADTSSPRPISSLAN
ncbi:uncharacterized protein LOC128213426 isoform X2 [Mya arenaria]|uniref:uncharacterized protein LOC128213426 isoform X2 n=1 Tax=Mya arenaria TaxID=6604 RepID=UPI0022E2CE3B|nr:uncharacterized protein LOC128213426 isoform X2 [Mya arenaria]